MGFPLVLFSTEMRGQVSEKRSSEHAQVFFTNTSGVEIFASINFRVSKKKKKREIFDKNFCV